MEAVCIMCKKPPLPVPNQKERVMSYWEASKKFMNEKHFLNEIKGYDKDNIDEKIMQKVRDKYITHKDFNAKRVEKASFAAKGLCEWILAISDYEKVLRFVKPK